MWLHGRKFLLVSIYLAKFGDYRPCGSRDIVDLVFHVALQNHMINEPCNCIEGSSSFYISILPSLVVVGIVEVDIFIILAYQVILQDRMII